jgi:serine/threonine protein kinase/cytochrome c-type biogenesis protein CcmH/NrfG
VDTLGEPVWVGRYRLTSRIATGGMAEIYVGREVSATGQFGPMVAVKKLLPHLAKDSAIVRMFLNEARITAQINHPNVVRIFELGQVDGEPFIAMELLEGRTWAELRQTAAENAKRMPAGVALRILVDACRGLHAAHGAVDENGKSLSLVHRDFTPDNIHVGVRGDVKVIDFGIARTTAWGAGTEPGTLKGKFFYMSPEMITAKPVDHRADIFAAGVMLYEQLCGRRPFTGISIDEVVLRIAREAPERPSTYDPAVPKSLESICLKAIAKEPHQRYQSLLELVQAIELADAETQLAEATDVAHYIVSLIPEVTDERRRNLKRAREADPSIPHRAAVQRSSAPHAVVAPPESETATHRDAVELGMPDVPDAPTIAATPAMTLPVPPVTAPRKRFRWAFAAVALVALGAGLYLALNRVDVTAAAQLELAAQVTGDARVDELLKLATLPGATEAELERGALLLRDTEDWEQARVFFDAWLKRFPTSVMARLVEAESALDHKKWKRVEFLLQEATELDAKEPRVDELLGRLREQQGDLTGALEAWTKAVTKAPTRAAYWWRQGYALSQLGRLDEAEPSLTKALKRHPDSLIAALVKAELGHVRLRGPQRDEAMKLLRGVVREKPELMEGHWYLAKGHALKGDAGAARLEFVAAEQRSGSNEKPVLEWCEFEFKLRSAELQLVKRRIQERFPQEAAALISKCAPEDR